MIPHRLPPTEGLSPIRDDHPLHGNIPNSSSVRLLLPSDLVEVNALLDSTRDPTATERIMNRLRIVMGRSDALVLVATAPENPSQLVSVGFVIQSMHAFGHCGINLEIIAPGFENSIEVKQLLSRLLEQGKGQFKDSEILDISLVPSKDLNTKSIVAFSVGTQYPLLFSEFGFHAVHGHMGPNGAEVVWMMHVPGRDVEYIPHEMTKSRIQPAYHPSVVRIENDLGLHQAKLLVAREWGDVAADNFCAEYHDFRKMPGSAVYSVREGEHTIGLGAIIKALHHDEAWSRAWIIVDPDRRGQGVAERLISGLLQHADDWHRSHALGTMVMEGFSYVPEYYERFGTKPVARARQQSLDGRSPTWTMRITD